MNAVKERDVKPIDPAGPAVSSEAMRLVGWQGFTLRVPSDCDLTGFSGDFDGGYLRIDDSDSVAVEIKWVTESPKLKQEPDPSGRWETYLTSLQKKAKQKKMELSARETGAARSVLRDDRRTTGFSWTSDKKATGAVWYCRTCRRVVIAQFLGDVSGSKPFGKIAERVLGSIACHADDPNRQVWALYDLYAEIPGEYRLVSQQLMNVYLRLSWEHKQSRLSIEQWSLANVARRDAYLDLWLAANSRGEMRDARYTVAETESHTHAAINMMGGLAVGTPMLNAVKQLTQLQIPPTRFSAVAWQCDDTNKLFLVQGMRRRGAEDVVPVVANQVRCHEGLTVEQGNT